MSKESIEIINSSLDGVPEINLRGMIDKYEDGSIAEAFDRCRDAVIRLNINSMGGSVNLGQEVIAAMQNFKNAGGIIETVNRGIAYSTAGWIFSAGSKGHRKMMPFSTLMTHPPAFADGKTLTDFQQGSEKWNILADAMNKLIDIFAPITGRTKNAIKKFMLGNTTFNAKQAVKEGFADEIIEISNSVVLKNDLQPEEIINATEAIDYTIQDKKTYNINIPSMLDEKGVIEAIEKAINKQPEPGKINKKSMKEVAKLLNLNPDASEESILQAVRDIQNRAETAEADKKASDTKLKQVETERDSIKNELSELKDTEIINYVEKYIGDSKERKEKRESLLNFAKSDFETFKSVCPLGGEGVTNKGAKIDEGIEPEGNEGDEGKKGVKDAQKFFNMSLAEREKLKIENISEYNKLVNAYDNNQTKIV